MTTSEAGLALGRAADRIERALQRTPVALFAAASVVLGVLKAGPRIVGELPTWDPADFPEPVDHYPFLSYGFRVVGVVTGAGSPEAYLRISIAAVVLALGVLCWLMVRAAPRPAMRAMSLIVLTGPIVWILVGGLGRVDALIVCGAAIAGALGRRPVWAVLGTLVAALGHPELAVVAALALVLLSLSSRYRAWRIGAILGLVVAIAIWLGLRAWALSLGQQTRDSIVGEFWRRSVEAFVVHLPVEVWAGFGLGIILIAWAIAGVRGWSRVVAVVVLLGFPIGLSLVTADQSRVWVLATVSAVFAIVVREGLAISQALARWLRYPLTALLAAAVMLPAVEIQFMEIRSPWVAVWPYLAYYVFG